MAFELERDWPIVAAGLTAVGGLAWLSMGRRVEDWNQPVAVGAPTEAYAAAVSAATQVEMGRQQMAGQVATAYLGIEAARLQAEATERIETARLMTAERIMAEQAAIAKAQIEGQLAAVRAQQAAQQQQSLFGFLGSIIPAVLPFLFSIERTAEAETRGRGGARGGLRRGLPPASFYRQVPGAPGGFLGIPRAFPEPPGGYRVPPSFYRRAPEAPGGFPGAPGDYRTPPGFYHRAPGAPGGFPGAPGVPGGFPGIPRVFPEPPGGYRTPPGFYRRAPGAPGGFPGAPRNMLYQTDLTALQTPIPGATLGIVARPRRRRT